MIKYMNENKRNHSNDKSQNKVKRSVKGEILNS